MGLRPRRGGGWCRPGRRRAGPGRRWWDRLVLHADLPFQQQGHRGGFQTVRGNVRGHCQWNRAVGVAIRQMIALSTSANPGSRTTAARRRAWTGDVQQRDEFAIVGQPVSHQAVMCSSVSPPLEVCRKTSRIAQDQNARCSCRPRSRRSPVGDRQPRPWRSASWWPSGALSCGGEHRARGDESGGGEAFRGQSALDVDAVRQGRRGGMVRDITAGDCVEMAELLLGGGGCSRHQPRNFVPAAARDGRTLRQCPIDGPRRQRPGPGGASLSSR